MTGNIIISAVAFVITLFGFLYGAHRLLFKKKPLFFKFLVLATGCYVLENLSDLVNYLTDGFEFYISLGTFGVFGTLMFLLSANYGTIDYITCEVKCPIVIKAVSVASSVLMLSGLVFVSVSTFPYGAEYAVTVFLMLLPVVPASYYTVKHILFRTDEMGILKAIRSGNAAALVFYVAELIMFVVASRSQGVMANAVNIVASAAIALVSVFAAEGEKRWKI